MLQAVLGQGEAFPMHAVLQEFDKNYAATMTAEAYARYAPLSRSCAHLPSPKHFSVLSVASALGSCLHALACFPFECVTAV